MKDADLAEAFSFDGSLLELHLHGYTAADLLLAMQRLADAVPCLSLVDDKPAELPDLTRLSTLLACGVFCPSHVDTGHLKLMFLLNFGLEPVFANLDPRDVEDQVSFERLVRLLSLIPLLPGQEIRLCAERFSAQPYAICTSVSGWQLT